MDKENLVQEINDTKQILEKIEAEVHQEPRTISIRNLLKFYYHNDPDKLNGDNPGSLMKVTQLVSDRSVHFLLFMFGVAYPISMMAGKLIHTFTHKVSLGVVSKSIVFDVTSNIFVYIALLVLYMFVIMILCRKYHKAHLDNAKASKKIAMFLRHIYNEVLQYVVNMFTIYATLVGTIFTISSSITKLKFVLIIAFFFSLIIIPILSISLFVSTISHINDMRE